MTPSHAYYIWAVPRSGGTLLSEALASTGVAGTPGEYLTVNNHPLAEHHNVETFAALRDLLWSMGSTVNGWFASKGSSHLTNHRKVMDHLQELSGTSSHQEVWDTLFPNCRHIFLTRRNKVRQAVSWWRAIKDEVWHLREGQHHDNDAAFYEKHYDFDALSHLFKESTLIECALEDYFTQHGIVPYTLVYEDFIRDYHGTVMAILEFLHIRTEGVSIAAPGLKRTADEGSELWVQRFRNDIQEGIAQVW